MLHDDKIIPNVNRFTHEQKTVKYGKPEILLDPLGINVNSIKVLWSWILIFLASWN